MAAAEWAAAAVEWAAVAAAVEWAAVAAAAWAAVAAAVEWAAVAAAWAGDVADAGESTGFLGRALSNSVSALTPRETDQQNQRAASRPPFRLDDFILALVRVRRAAADVRFLLEGSGA